jgi:hypothetical protein
MVILYHNNNDYANKIDLTPIPCFPLSGTAREISNAIATALCPRDGLQPFFFIVRRGFEESKGI